MIGETLDGKYKLVRLLGQGGMGTVYEAEQTGAPGRVAVKVIAQDMLGSDGARRFRREARAASVAGCDFIVKVLDAGEEEATGRLYLAMELLEGEDLQQLIDRVGALEPGGALRIAAQALVGLSKAHDAGIVHRDIKPGNLFLARGEGGSVTVKLLDFGIAKVTVDLLQSAQSTALTSTGDFLGSPLYMSPEQVLSSRDVDHRTDLWSLGSVLYCALSGRPPHGDIESVGRLVFNICSTPPPPLREVAPWVPPAIAAIVERSLEMHPDKRYASALAMFEEIARLLPEGTALHERMLAPISEQTRAAVPPDEPASPALATTVRSSTPPSEKDAPTADVPSHSPGESGERRSEERPGPQQRPRSATRTGATPSLVLGLVLAGALGYRSFWRAETRPDPSPAPVHAAAPAPALPSALPSRRVKLAIAPEDAAVEVDGTSAPVREGSVEIVGTPGSGHRVLLRKGAIEQVFDVFVTEAGAQPPRVTLPEDMPAPPAAMTAPRADAVRASATRPGASAPATLRLMAPPPPPMPAPPQSTPAPIPDKDGLERSAE